MNLTTHPDPRVSSLVAIKIQCGCGQKYAFDADPAGGKMAALVQCPVCGADGTAIANQVLAHHLRAPSNPGPLGGQKLPFITPEAPVPRRTSLPAAGAPRGERPGHSTWLLLVGVGLLALVALIFWLRRPGSAAAAAPQDGYPHTLAQLNAWYSEPPAGQNAAFFYSQGFDLLQIGNEMPLFAHDNMPALGRPLPSTTLRSLGAFLKLNQGALQAFAQALPYEHSRYAIDLNQGIATTFPHLTKVRQATQVAALSALWHAENKEGQPVLEGLLTALGLVRSLEAEPSLISQFIRMGGSSNTTRAVEQTLNRITLKPEQLRLLRTALQKAEDVEARGEPFNRAIVAERVILQALLATPQKLVASVNAPGVGLPDAERELILARLQKPRQLKEDGRFYEETFAGLISRRQLPFPDRLQAGDWIGRQVAKAHQNKLALSAWLISGLAPVQSREAGALAQLRLALTAVALEQFRQSHQDHYPAGLAELTPDLLPNIPADPFDGQPLRYSNRGSAYQLYSIGWDRQDDSGQPWNSKTGDILFTVGAAR